jgi:FKBP-type peptidyl-prolyl cis-trans isomerase
LKRQTLLSLLAFGLLLAAAACGRLNSPQDKAGYAIGMSIGHSVYPVKDKLDLGRFNAGFEDAVAGKPGMDMQAVGAEIQKLRVNAPDVDAPKASYALGVNIGTNLARMKDDLSLPKVLSGLKDQLAGKTRLTDDEAHQILMDFSRRESEKANPVSEQDKAAAAKNKADGDAFLAENRKKPGVTVTASGLQYQVLKQGTGPKPTVNDKVRVHYRGTLIDGKEFDSSYKRKVPAEFPVTGVIPGWVEALQLMPVGSKYRLVIPAAIAYGDRASGAIPPGSVLVFEVELLAIVK